MCFFVKQLNALWGQGCDSSDFTDSFFTIFFPFAFNTLPFIRQKKEQWVTEDGQHQVSASYQTRSLPWLHRPQWWLFHSESVQRSSPSFLRMIAYGIHKTIQIGECVRSKFWSRVSVASHGIESRWQLRPSINARLGAPSGKFLQSWMDCRTINPHCGENSFPEGSCALNYGAWTWIGLGRSWRFPEPPLWSTGQTSVLRQTDKARAARNA